MGEIDMARSKFFPRCSSQKKSEIGLMYQSATESTFGLGLSSSCRGQYERIGSDVASSSTPATKLKKAPKAHKTLKLGGNTEGKVPRSRSARLQGLFKAPSTLICKMKEQYAVWKDGARCANLRVSDLFVGNQLFWHVQAPPVTSLRKQQPLQPSVGFVTKLKGSSTGQREMRER